MPPQANPTHPQSKTYKNPIFISQFPLFRNSVGTFWTTLENSCFNTPIITQILRDYTLCEINKKKSASPRTRLSYTFCPTTSKNFVTDLVRFVYIRALRGFNHPRVTYLLTGNTTRINALSHAIPHPTPVRCRPNPSLIGFESRRESKWISTRIKTNLGENRRRFQLDWSPIQATSEVKCSAFTAKKRFLRSLCDTRKVLRTSRQFRSLHSLQLTVASLLDSTGSSPFPCG